jgi:hypothetical protein
MQEAGPYDLYFVESDTIRDIDTLPLCYSQIRIITEKLFYYADSSHTVKLPIPAPPVNTRDFNILDQTQKIINALLLLNNSLMSDLVNEFSSYLNHMETPIEAISFILGNSYQQIISELSINYPQLEIEFPSYKSLLSKLCEFHFLYEYID